MTLTVPLSRDGHTGAPNEEVGVHCRFSSIGLATTTPWPVSALHRCRPGRELTMTLQKSGTVLRDQLVGMRLYGVTSDPVKATKRGR